MFLFFVLFLSVPASRELSSASDKLYAMKPRSDLDTMLDTLERGLPGMQERLPDASEFWREFSQRANDIRGAAGPHDLVHVDGRIQQMLASAGVAENHPRG